MYRYVYGPVPSWRLGGSLGIDLLSQEEKICNFDCVYCQLGRTKKHTAGTMLYVPVEKIMEELKFVPVRGIDYITFSGRGECTLAMNLGEAIRAVKAVRKEPVAVITNGSLMGNDEVREQLSSADFVVAKLDAWSEGSLRKINRPAAGIGFAAIVEGMKAFRGSYGGKFALQIMFIDKNKNECERYISLANRIRPDEVQINTPLRPCGIEPLSKQEIAAIKDRFVRECPGIRVISVYDEITPKKVVSLSDEDTLRRRGKVE